MSRGCYEETASVEFELHIERRTLGGHGQFVVGTAEQPGAVEDLVDDDAEAVDVALLSSSRQTDDCCLLRRHQLLSLIHI